MKTSLKLSLTLSLRGNLKFKARRGFFSRNYQKAESFSLNCERTVGDYLSGGLTCTGGSDERENYSNCQHIQISAKYQNENDCLEHQQRHCIWHKLAVPLVGFCISIGRFVAGEKISDQLTDQTPLSINSMQMLRGKFIDRLICCHLS